MSSEKNSTVSAFAKAQLLKYGWSEGKGLGKDENGMVEPLKPKFKKDNEGVGFKKSNENWWESMLNKSLGNIEVTPQAGGTVNVSTKFNVSSDSSSNETKPFLKSATLANGLLVEESRTPAHSEKLADLPAIVLTDEELFKACGGRTAHKGARHGLNMGGKLARIDEQEKSLISLDKASKEEFFKQIVQREKENQLRRARVIALDNDTSVPDLLDSDLTSIAAQPIATVPPKTSKKYRKRLAALTESMDKMFRVEERGEKTKAKEETKHLKKIKKKDGQKIKKSTKAMSKALELINGDVEMDSLKMLCSVKDKKMKKEVKTKRKGKRQGGKDIQIITQAITNGVQEDSCALKDTSDNKFSVLCPKKHKKGKKRSNLSSECTVYANSYLDPVRKIADTKSKNRKKNRKKKIKKQKIKKQIQETITQSDDGNLKNLSIKLSDINL